MSTTSALALLLAATLASGAPQGRGIEVVADAPRGAVPALGRLRPLPEPGGHAQGTTDLAVHAPSSSVATVGADGSLRLWSLQTGQALRVIRPPEGEGGRPALLWTQFSPDGKQILTGGAEFRFLVAERTTGALSAQVPVPDGSPLAVSFDEPGRRVLLMPYSGGPRWYAGPVYDRASGRLSLFSPGYATAAALRGGAFATCSGEGNLRLHAPAGRVLRRVDGRGEPCGIFEASPDRRWLLVAGIAAKALRVYDAKNLEVATNISLAQSLTAAAWSGTNEVIAFTQGNEAWERWQALVAKATATARESARAVLGASSSKLSYLDDADYREMALRALQSAGYPLPDFEPLPNAFASRRVAIPSGETVGGSREVPHAVYEVSVVGRDSYVASDRRSLWRSDGGQEVWTVPAATMPQREIDVTLRHDDAATPASGKIPSLRLDRDGSTLTYMSFMAPDGRDFRFAEFSLAGGIATQAAADDVDLFGLAQTWFADLTSIDLTRDDVDADAAIAALGTARWPFRATPGGTAKVGGKAVPLGDTEEARATLDLPASGDVLVMTDWRLWCVKADGVVRWRGEEVVMPTAVTASGDGRFVVAAFVDGTIRWFAARTGEERLAYFPHADGRRWVAWTPDGYYAASIGGEELLVLVDDGGPTRARAQFPASQFRDQLWRPDIVAAALSDRPAGARPMAVAVPPLVSILSPEEGAVPDEGRVVVAVAVQSLSGQPVGAVEAFVDGRRVEAEVLSSGDARDLLDRRVALSVPVSPGQRVISVRASTANADSTAVHLRLGSTGDPAPAALRVLAVGVGDYQRLAGRRDLEFPAKDVADVSTVLGRQGKRLFGSVTARSLTDGEATRDAVLDGLQWLVDTTDTTDVAVVTLAGHGFTGDGGAFHFAPVDGDPARMAETMVSGEQVMALLGRVKGKVLLLLDACHGAGAVGEGVVGALTDARSVTALAASAPPDRGQDARRFVNELASAGTGVVVLAAAEGGQTAWESREWGNGAFTLAVVEGLSGKADPTGSGRVTVESLTAYVRQRVASLTGGRQTPTLLRPVAVPDFPLALTGKR